MKTFFITLTLLAFTLTSQAQEWFTNMDEAQKVAKAENRPIVLVFQGSDWCAPCIKLDKEIFQSDTFKLYAKDHFVMVEADFPRKKANALAPDLQARNNALAERFNTNGIFPFVVVMDNDLKVLGQTGYYKTTPTKYILELDSFTR